MFSFRRSAKIWPKIPRSKFLSRKYRPPNFEVLDRIRGFLKNAKLHVIKWKSIWKRIFVTLKCQYLRHNMFLHPVTPDVTPEVTPNVTLVGFKLNSSRFLKFWIFEFHKIPYQKWVRNRKIEVTWPADFREKRVS